MDKRQVTAIMVHSGIAGIVSGSGKDWQVQIPNEEMKAKFLQLIPAESQRTDDGSWIMSPSPLAGYDN